VRLVEAEVDLDRAAKIVGTSPDAVRELIGEGIVRCESGTRSPLKFSEVCNLLAVTTFRRVNNSADNSSADDAAAISRLPMLAFASHLAEARYNVRGPLVRTTHPSHVPERYVILIGRDVLRVGTLEQFERVRADEVNQTPSFHVFDTKAAVECVINAMETCPFRWLED